MFDALETPGFWIAVATLMYTTAGATREVLFAVKHRGAMRPGEWLVKTARRVLCYNKLTRDWYLSARGYAEKGSRARRAGTSMAAVVFAVCVTGGVSVYASAGVAALAGGYAFMGYGIGIMLGKVRAFAEDPMATPGL